MSNIGGYTVSLFGRIRKIFDWPVIQLGIDPNGKAAPMQTDASGNLKVNVAASAEGAAHFAVSNKTASAVGTISLAARATRRSVSILCLDDSAETVYYGPTTGVNASTGARLKAGQSQAVDTTAAIFFFGAAGTGTIQCVESYD